MKVCALLSVIDEKEKHINEICLKTLSTQGKNVKVNLEEEAATEFEQTSSTTTQLIWYEFSFAYVDMLSKLELCYVAVWGKSLLSTHMLVGSSNRNVEMFCGSNSSCVG